VGPFESRVLVCEVAPRAAAIPALHVAAKLRGIFRVAAQKEGLQLVERGKVEEARAVADGGVGVFLDEVAGESLVELIVHEEAGHAMSLGETKERWGVQLWIPLRSQSLAVLGRNPLLYVSRPCLSALAIFH
jgi:hypothetical protein